MRPILYNSCLFLDAKLTVPKCFNKWLLTDCDEKIPSRYLSFENGEVKMKLLTELKQDDHIGMYDSCHY